MAESSNGFRPALDPLLQGLAGGFLLGVPLLYTMEVWWLGTWVEPPFLLFGILLSLLPVFLLTSTAGFRQSPRLGRLDVFTDTVEALGIAAGAALFVLFILRRVSFDTPVYELVGKVVYEAVPFAIGVAVAREVLKASADEPTKGKPPAKEKESTKGTLADLGATSVGALFIASTIAPTQEVPMISGGLTGIWVLVLIAASLVISYGIVFAAGFQNEEKRRNQLGVLQHPITETVVSYVLALAVAAALLLFFRNVRLDDPLSSWITEVVVLGFPATIGGAAGRLAV